MTILISIKRIKTQNQKDIVMDEANEKQLNQSQDDKILIDHSYDGIQELDNRPPPWIMWLLYITIIWSALYLGYYHLFWQEDVGPQDKEYLEELAEAAKMQEKRKADQPETAGFDESKIAVLNDEASLTEGKEIFEAKGCAACHGALGEGNAVGPNLTDQAWINGGEAEDVFKIIKYGNTAKGMMPYKAQLKDEEIQKLTSWILVKLKGSNPPNAKAPEGQ